MPDKTQETVVDTLAEKTKQTPEPKTEKPKSKSESQKVPEEAKEETKKEPSKKPGKKSQDKAPNKEATKGKKPLVKHMASYSVAELSSRLSREYNVNSEMILVALRLGQKSHYTLQEAQALVYELKHKEVK